MISVIIPTYNYARYIMSAFHSVVWELDKDSLEVIIVDDASTDQTKDVVNDIFRPFKFPERNIHYIPLNVNGGVSVARNIGLKISKGDYITFLDADDMRVPGSLRLQKIYLDKHPKIDVVWGKALEVRGDLMYYEACQKMRKLRVHPSEVNPQTVMYRRRVFERFGGWYEGLRSGEDKEMSMRLGIHPDSPFNHVKKKKIDIPVAFYRKHSEEKHKKRKADNKWYKETKQLQKKRLRQMEKKGITRENTMFPI